MCLDILTAGREYIQMYAVYNVDFLLLQFIIIVIVLIAIQAMEAGLWIFLRQQVIHLRE